MNFTYTQEEIGHELGCSSRTIKRQLIRLGLINQQTQLPTSYAIEKQLAQQVIQDDISVTRWNSNIVYYIKDNCINDIHFCMQILFYRLRILKHIDEKGSSYSEPDPSSNEPSYDKQPMEFDHAYCDFLGLWDIISPHPQLIYHFVQRLEKLHWLNWMEKFEEMENISTIAHQYYLDTNLSINSSCSTTIKI